MSFVWPWLYPVSIQAQQLQAHPTNLVSSDVLRQYFEGLASAGVKFCSPSPHNLASTIQTAATPLGRQCTQALRMGPTQTNKYSLHLPLRKIARFFVRTLASGHCQDRNVKSHSRAMDKCLRCIISTDFLYVGRVFGGQKLKPYFT